MKCPRTGTDLKPVTIEGITVDLSEACGGVWFDNYELMKFDEVHETGGDEIAKLMEKHRSENIDLNQRLQCPKCDSIVMARHYFSAKKAVEIDRCPMCGGIWLDAGELEKIRLVFPTASDREQSAQAFVKQVSTFAGMDQMLQASEEKATTARKFANLFSWVCPSRYIPGKQDGAAF